ncbi:G-protein coupled receptor 84-like [Nerophis ophidion]|uniref:G-protein coupled receptor 84-like n=1 Tax=Nerophis ophidion TaxID=159077 RepID=UPI002AE0AA2F|nr:G-protein coupled receptor 84-like [Nerophis ophidion]XP_061746452.1 G-protein coupled receptor 84-like [Nerophis ophidion]
MLQTLTNQTEDGFSCYSPSVEVYRYFAVLWGCSVTVTGTVGNLMTILAFASDSQLRTRFNVLIVNLALADLLYCTVLQPISVDSYLHLRWRSGELWCRIFGLLLFLSNSVSTMTLCLVAISRYLLVEKRAVFDRVFSDRGLACLLIATWALGLACSGPLWSVYVFVPQVCICSFHRIRGRPYTTILLFFYFFVGLACVGTFNFLIYRRVRLVSLALLRYRFSRRSSKKKAPETDESSVRNSMATCSSELGTQGKLTEMEDPLQNMQCKTSKKPSAHKPNADVGRVPPSNPASSGEDLEFKRVTRMCFGVFLSFVFCFFPFMLLNIADKRSSAPRVLHMLCSNLTWLNSCINPILYAVMNRQFRRAYNVLLTRAATPFSYLWMQSS